ncbi:hypothetical protein N7489_008032 [Penicillium chrysogenum]|uniref:Uncharacterized protein n=1 Tax=Penicillium chrysogenum TaxID=5076 RepID=A0ABQ8WAE0_PENCH|nr:uncharacterized protein N7489_008032 [Penicillium chrysogenum]KAJ5237941.1 hypothetical protein N7489_008032 [Penicillium chrysogenum]KAJ5261801.1 hypothetical protein N7505_008668 [Penicillium chrysogenum]KAJ6159729.1 hypothetical protein N7497_004266 [Penicillium chrysogenum]
MTSSLPWFRKGTDPGTIITFDKPLSSRWEILEKLNEYDDQATVEQNRAYGFHSFASAKFLCCDPQRRATEAFMRVYIQVPHRTTEMDDADTRGQQAMSWTPEELASLLDLTEKGSNITPKLLGYKIGTQDRSGLVPGGFIIRFVWEIVPGLRLGDRDGAGPFWGLKNYERDQVRASFLNALAKLKEHGWYPGMPRARSLVWHRDTQTCYFIGRFSETMEGPPRRLAEPAQHVATFELALPDVPVRWRDWDKDTSRWKW